ncbi:hypothetical protein CDAR_555821 [Caerostris darwini]|uniref:Uncharacterized protein n=1 Tax=Caerostris darwini TaxID=1538125 RepID=A0AAV4NRP7_9ARAC|nr:hypothetical protein CDAR_555821 [Caerostris darwini]
MISCQSTRHLKYHNHVPPFLIVPSINAECINAGKMIMMPLFQCHYNYRGSLCFYDVAEHGNVVYECGIRLVPAVLHRCGGADGEQPAGAVLPGAHLLPPHPAEGPRGGGGGGGHEEHRAAHQGETDHVGRNTCWQELLDFDTNRSWMTAIRGNFFSTTPKKTESPLRAEDRHVFTGIRNC